MNTITTTQLYNVRKVRGKCLSGHSR
ncbi:hypothetical protein CAEBREN_14372 [Caenorhabditis brenneri]|uniref:Uncharacterized protein n=1 Tax=Caenorhabditis brenneri TaxID=135651 RepID=G0MV18_CAEBE|nr:hypothetical protein CAEBREN_14372 [Caenorhabditis brenneri]